VWGTVLLGVVVPSLGDDLEYCVRAQQLLAQTEELPAVQVHQTRDSFIESKAFDEPFTVHQYWSSPVAGEGSMPTVVSCKMRTAERINAAHSPGAVPVAQGDLSCDVLHREMLEQVYTAVPSGEQAVPRGQWVVDEEQVTYMGPRWLEPWPFEPLARGDEGGLHLQTRALYVPKAWWIPMPDRFLGNYYCHLIAPDYLRALVRGEFKPGV